MTIEPSAPEAAVLPPEFFNDPGENRHADLAALRAQCPVHKINHPPGAEAYIVVDYATVSAAFSDPRLSKRTDNAPEWFRALLADSSPVLTKNMLVADPPEHTRLRKLVAKAFTPRRMELLRPRVQEITDELIDALPATGPVNLVSEFAFALPMRVICEFLGVPLADRPRLHEWGTLLSGAPYPDEETNLRLKWASEQIESYLKEQIAARRTEPGEDLVSALVRAADEDDVFSDDELVSTLVLLIIAGHKTTANLIGNGTEALLRHPDQLELLRTRPELAPTAIEEFLRFEAPVFRGTLRVAAEDMQIAGVDIPKEAFVHLMMTSANRDPEQFEDPDRLDISRSPNRHLSFGHGAHFCAGAPLSRVEGQIAFTTLLRRLPGLRLAEPPKWLYDNSTSRGLSELLVSYDEKLPR
ncbi:cytochrome P450 [Amycolatopsis sp. FDAARGOS 1241]|uniref:cytochrome P450 family protein n=1 Tax=Amycolatopsis sp. FDAARGOS 1241 TaxID=2778070 RepID=UPI0019505CD2|nr:cytochrome P450 [Amycolatopsis sp. FDAARGOS 1241]QRP47066.1 cytochrome P450 [Amycolatopsis sp. FDAARGOS 1241]